MTQRLRLQHRRLVVGVAAVLAGGCLVPVAFGATVDVLIDSADVKLERAEGGKHAAKVSIANLRDTTVVVSASVRGDEGCDVTPDPTSIDSGRRRDVTFTLGSGCEVEEGVDITLALSPGVMPSRPVIAAAPPSPDAPDWSILVWAFLIAAVAALLLILEVDVQIYQRNHRPPPHESAGGPRAPTIGDAGTGPLPPGTYRYAVTLVKRNGETARGAESDPLVLTSPGKIKLTDVPKGRGVLSRRIYRSFNGRRYVQVGELDGNATSTYTDTWIPISARTSLAGLGTDWSFKDNWVGTVTVGSTVLVALLATSSVLEAVLGTEPKAALGLLAVAGALAAVLVGIGPLIVKLVGHDVTVPTVGGTLLAAFVTLVGSLGQIAAMAWQGFDLMSGAYRALPVVLGAGVGLVVCLYAARALWDTIETGVDVPAAKRPDALQAADIVAAAISAPRTRRTRRDDEETSEGPTAPEPDLSEVLGPFEAAAPRRLNSLL